VRVRKVSIDLFGNRHSGGSRNPGVQGLILIFWIPASAGMTKNGVSEQVYSEQVYSEQVYSEQVYGVCGRAIDQSSLHNFSPGVGYDFPLAPPVHFAGNVNTNVDFGSYRMEPPSNCIILHAFGSPNPSPRPASLPE